MEQFGPIDSEGQFPRKQWNEVLRIINGRDYKSISDPSGRYPVYGSGGLMGRATEYLCPENTVVVGRKGTIDKPFVVTEKFWNVDTAFGVVPNQGVLHYLYLFWYCKQLDFKKLNKASTLPSTTKEDLLKLWINIPPFEQQEQFALFVRQSDKSKFAALSCSNLNLSGPLAIRIFPVTPLPRGGVHNGEISVWRYRKRNKRESRQKQQSV